MKPATRPRTAPSPPARGDGAVSVDTAPAVSSVHTPRLPGLLKELGISLLVSTYQANTLVVVRVNDGVLNTHLRSFASPMGIAAGAGRLAIGTKTQVLVFQNQPAVARELGARGPLDACYLPRGSHVTGDIRVHDVAYADGDELWVVNTRFSCLCTLRGDCSFVPRWRPPFVSETADGDRCHLNGLAVAPRGLRRGGRLEPRFVTCLGESDAPAGWRANKAHGGCLIDTATNDRLVRGLSMPHSPRWYDGRLWVLESGVGTLALVDRDACRLTTVATLPGFTRGVDFCGHYAFVGLSQVRETAAFGGIPISRRPPQQRLCGVWVVDLRTAETAAFLRFDSGVHEIFAIQVLPGVRHPEILPDSDALVADSFVVPAAVPACQRLGCPARYQRT